MATIAVFQRCLWRSSHLLQGSNRTKWRAVPSCQLSLARWSSGRADKSALEAPPSYDARPVSLRVLSKFPAAVQPHLRLIRFDRPVGYFMVLWPGVWSLALASQSAYWPEPLLLGYFVVGAVLMRGSGCIINDLWDVEIDRKVERTKFRPLACGQVTQLGALCTLAGCLSVCLAILLQLNGTTQLLGVVGLCPVVVYPLMKRFTYWPQAFLGTTINWGALMGWSAVNGGLSAASVALYVGCLFWTLHYDTIYAHQDKDDDIFANVKSTALLLGDKWTKPFLAGCSTLCCGGLLLSGYLAGQTWPYYAAVGLFTSHLFWQSATVNLSSTADCLHKFKVNARIGWLLLFGILAGNAVNLASSV